jgi:multimeric flavodoxin WrbA
VIIVKILAVSGSPRKRGNTSLLLDEALSYANKENIETEKIELYDFNFSDCKGCEGCKSSLKCVIQDDMQTLYPKILESDALILGSPTYFYNITAKMKAFIDRMYCYELFDEEQRNVWIALNECIQIKYALVISVCEQSTAEDAGFTSEAMAKPLEALGYRVVEKVRVLNAFEKGDVLSYQNELKKVRGAGKKLIKTLQLREAVKKLSEKF